MARVIETALLNPVDGKTRAQQVARLKEWKKHFLAMGADKVVVKESGPGNINGAWIFEIHHNHTYLSWILRTHSYLRTHLGLPVLPPTQSSSRINCTSPNSHPHNPHGCHCI